MLTVLGLLLEQVNVVNCSEKKLFPEQIRFSLQILMVPQKLESYEVIFTKFFILITLSLINCLYHQKLFYSLPDVLFLLTDFLSIISLKKSEKEKK